VLTVSGSSSYNPAPESIEQQRSDPTIGNSRPDSAPHMYARPEIRAGVARLAAHGLTLDAWCYHPQLADVIALARAAPQATIVMCHVGGVFG
jgi:L-fuconolactonase